MIPEPQMVAFGPFHLDIDNGLLFQGTHELPLPPRALALLIYFVQHKGQVVSKQALMDAIWKDVVVEESSLKEAISLLRQVLGDDPQEPRYIQTVHRRGYRFVGILGQQLPEPASAAPAVPLAPPPPPEEPLREHAVPVRRRAWLKLTVRQAGVISGLLLVGAIAGWYYHSIHKAQAPSTVMRFMVSVPDGYQLAVSPFSNIRNPILALSADGSKIAFVARKGDNESLFVRSLDQMDAVAIAGSDGAESPFFSPDGHWIGFFSGGLLKIAPLGGGSVTILCKVNDDYGASWDADNNIVFGTSEGLHSISALGGTPSVLTRADTAGGEESHTWPEVLPNGSVLFSVFNIALHRRQIGLYRPDVRGYKIIFDSGSSPHYLPDGRLLFTRDGNIMTVPFDLKTGAVTGMPTVQRNDVLSDTYTGVTELAVAANGSTVLVRGHAHDNAATIVWTDDKGRPSATNLPVRAYINASLSKDGRRLAGSLIEGETYDVWSIGMQGGTFLRVSSGGENYHPIWSPDGNQIAYLSSLHPYAVTLAPANGGMPQEIAVPTTFGKYPTPTSYTPDGRTLAITFYTDNGSDIGVILLDKGNKVVDFTHIPGNERYAHFSPDGHWLAYVSDVSGQFANNYQIYLRAYPGPGAPQSVYVESTSAGSQPDQKGFQEPFWAPDGRAIYYQDGDDILKISLQFAGDSVTGRSAKLFSVTDLWLRGISPDGQRLLFLKRTADKNAGMSSEMEISIQRPAGG